jgi:hypothetical protein
LLDYFSQELICSDFQVFPYDYKTGEFGGWKDYKFNVTTFHIDLFAHLGWAYDRKYASAELIAKKVSKFGDGSHYLSHEAAHATSLWGFGDEDLEKEDANILSKLK